MQHCVEECTKTKTNKNKNKKHSSAQQLSLTGEKDVPICTVIGERQWEHLSGDPTQTLVIWGSSLEGVLSSHFFSISP